MPILKSFKQVVYQFDMFCSSELLRYRSETQYKTLTGGLVSLVIISVVFGGFASMVVDTINKVTIDSSLVVQKLSNPPLATLQADTAGMFMLGISIRSFDYTFIADLINGPQYFTLQFNLVEMDNGVLVNRTVVSMEKCTIDHWSMMPDVGTFFYSYGMTNWLCLPIGMSFPLQGSTTSPTYSLAGIQVYSCKNSSSSSNCAPQEDIDALMSLHNNFYISWNYINPVINANQQNFISYYMESNDYVGFSTSIGSQAWVYFSDYTINTDDSVWPYNHLTTATGCIVEQRALSHPYTVTEDMPFGRIYFAKSSISLTYNRQVQKISAVLSYIGGLIGAITGVLFFIKSYTDTSLEMAIGLRLFGTNQQEGENPITAAGPKEKRFHIFDFVRLHSYRLLKFCGWKGKSDWSAHLARCRLQAVKQMDVELLLRRVIKLETCINLLFTSQQLKEIRECQQINCQNAKKMRLLLLSQSQKADEHDQNSQKENPQEMKAEIKDMVGNYPSEGGNWGEGYRIDSDASIIRNKQRISGYSNLQFQVSSDIESHFKKIQELKIVNRGSFFRRNKIANDIKVFLDNGEIKQ